MLPDFIPAYSVAPFFGLAANGALAVLCLIVYLTDTKYRPTGHLFLFYAALCLFFLGYTAYGMQKGPKSILVWYRVMLAGLALLPLGQIWFARGFLHQGSGVLAWFISGVSLALAGLCLLGQGPAMVGLPLEPFGQGTTVLRPASHFLRPAVFLHAFFSCLIFIWMVASRITRRNGRKNLPLFLYLSGLTVWALSGLHDIAFSMGWRSPLGGTALWVAGLALSFALMATVALHTAELAHKVRRARDVFERFVPPAYLNRIARRGLSSIRLGEADKQEVTILYSDIRGFTDMSGRLTPEALVTFMNVYLESMARAVDQHQGVIDKYIGDAVLCVFEGEGADLRAVACGVEMISRARGLCPPVGVPGSPLRIGIGVHCGAVILGTIGSAQRMDSTVMGMPVNLAARLESATKVLACDLLVSSQVVESLPPGHGHDLRPLGDLWVKGGAEPVRVWEVFNLDPPATKAAKKQAAGLVSRAFSHMERDQVDQASQALAEACLLVPGDPALARLTAGVARALGAGESPIRPNIDLRG